MQGKYLITTDCWFLAPDGQQYKAVWGDVTIVDDSVLGIKTNRNSVNWYARIGTDEKHIIVAGCQIHYAFKTDKQPNKCKVNDWSLEGDKYREVATPSRIYIIN